MWQIVEDESKHNANTFSANHSYYDTSHIEEYVDSNLAKKSLSVYARKKYGITILPFNVTLKGKVPVKIYEGGKINQFLFTIGLRI